MECFSPITIKDPRVPHMDRYIRVPCGKCLACRVKLTNHWFVRIYDELKTTTGYFITLTYDDEHLPFDKNGAPMVSKDDIQKFMKRFRKFLGVKGIRYFLCSEYGPNTFRPHYHMLLWNVPLKKEGLYLALLDTWHKGFVSVRAVTDSRIKYCVKYCLCETDLPEGLTPVFRLMSKGIGKDYVANRGYWHSGNLDHYYYPYGKFHYPLPRYFAERLYTSDERAEANIRWQSSLPVLETHEDFVNYELRKRDYESTVMKKYKKSRKKYG